MEVAGATEKRRRSRGPQAQTTPYVLLFAIARNENRDLTPTSRPSEGVHPKCLSPRDKKTPEQANGKHGLQPPRHLQLGTFRRTQNPCHSLDYMGHRGMAAAGNANDKTTGPCWAWANGFAVHRRPTTPSALNMPYGNRRFLIPLSLKGTLAPFWGVGGEESGFEELAPVSWEVKPKQNTSTSRSTKKQHA